MRVLSYVVALALAGAWGCGGESLAEDHGQTGGSGGVGANGGKGGSVSGGTGGTSGSATGGSGGDAGGVGGGAASGGSAGASTGGTTGGVSGSSSGGDAGVSTGGTSGGAGGAGGTGTGGNGGTVSAGQGGVAGMASSGTCTDPDAATSAYSATRSTTVGDNGSFTDACDADGNLREQTCEYGPCLSTRIAFPTGGGGGVPCTPVPTGQVIEVVIDCGGLCHDGVCFDWCADFGDVFEIAGVDGSTLDMTHEGYDYSCTVAFQRDGFDCLSPSMVGRSLTVTSLGSCAGPSTTFGWDDPANPLLEECAFTCAAL